MIAVIDYGAGNLRSVINAVSSLGFEPVVTSDAADIRRADKVILPGVGAAGSTVDSLKACGLAGAVAGYIASGRPFLGICIGMQVLFSHTEEGGGSDCLGIIPGVAGRLQVRDGFPVPNMGWCPVTRMTEAPVLEGIDDGSYFYFVHSYALPPSEYTIATARHADAFSAVVGRDNFIAAQFHPERSSADGARLLRNFLEMRR